MREFAKSYLGELIDNFRSFEVSDVKGEKFDVYETIEKVVQIVTDQSLAGQKLMFIGNGASAAISSHMATDYWKNGGIRAVAFNDSSLLTCVSNDYGYKHVFEKPIEMFADAGDILFAISSSGNSENIIRGVKAARTAKCKVVTFSGFDEDNPLQKLGDVNLWVDSKAYNYVENMHQIWLLAMVDLIIGSREYSA